MGRLIVRQDHPFNAEPPLALLGQTAITPSDLFFVRNHGNMPPIDPASYHLIIEGAPQSLSLTLDELRLHFARVTAEVTLQCAGNRRRELMAYKPIPDEVDWGEAVIGNGTWGGARLRDVLRAAGIKRLAEHEQHVAFEGIDQIERQSRTIHFGGSIPLEKAMQPEVMLAYEMNGAALAAEHGFPVRVVVPGYIGARSVKWLKRIIVQDAPSDNYFQAQAYRLFAPQVTAETVDWNDGLMLGEMSINAVIATPADAAQLPPGPIDVRGYALAGGERHVAYVAVSIDHGRSWITAEWESADEPWTWRLWKARLMLALGEHDLIVRAVDSAANTQPETVEGIWNFKGYMNNAWHRVRVVVR